MTTSSALHHRWSLLSLVVLAAGLAVGCGDDGGDPEAQPTVGSGTAFSEGGFEDLPLPPLAEPAGERSEEDGVQTRSYFVRNRTPEEVLAFYRDLLAERDAQVIAGPEPFGATVWRGTWLIDGRELLVSAQPAPTADGERVDGEDVVTQLSLELSPEGSGGHLDG